MSSLSEKPAFSKPVVTPEARVAFPFLAKPNSSGPYADGKYKVTLLFDKSADLSELNKAIDQVVQEKFKGIDLNSIQLPFKDGDLKKDLDGYAGCTYIVCKSKNPPGMVDRYRENIDPEKIYGGCFARAQVTACSYNSGGRPGVTLLLNNLQFLDDGPRFGPTGSPSTVFDDGAYNESSVEAFAAAGSN